LLKISVIPCPAPGSCRRYGHRGQGQTAKSGDIVIAQVDGEWTMKFLRKRGDSITLVPANPKYQPIKPKNELKIAGVVTAVRKYK
jgi:repressor LexA